MNNGTKPGTLRSARLISWVHALGPVSFASAAEAFPFFRLLRQTPPRPVGERHRGSQKGKRSHAMFLYEVITIEGDAEKLSAGNPQAKIGNHRILNGGVTQIPSCVGRQKGDARTWL